MELPKAIQRQADEATVAEAAVAQHLQNTEVALTDPSQPPPADSQPIAVQQAPTPAPVADDPNSATWQQRFKSLQGMFAQKTGELQAQTKTYESQMTNMQRQLDALMQTRKQDEAKEKKAADPKDVENFGADMIEMVQRYAQQVFTGMTEQFGEQSAQTDRRITALEQQVTGVTNRTEVTLEQQFYAALNGVVPNWEQINKDDRWLAWLSEVDPVYGATRQAALDHARGQLDVQRVANVFNAFALAHPAKPQSSLANQVAPNGASAPAPLAPKDKQLLSAKAVEKFYNEVAKGRYKGNEAEAERIDAEINQAAREGRIR